eukprot:363980_1
MVAHPLTHLPAQQRHVEQLSLVSQQILADASCHECPYCNEKFTQSGSLNRHIKLHSINSKEYKCKLCPKSFKTQRYLNTHISTLHTEKPFECNFCLKRFGKKSNMNVHIGIKHDPSFCQYECDICHQRLPNTTYLKRHKRHCS